MLLAFPIWLALCFIASTIALKKGRSGPGFFWLSFFLSPLVGILAAFIASPNNETLERSRIESGVLRKCPYCAELIKREAHLCRFCGRESEALGQIQAPPVGVPRGTDAPSGGALFAIIAGTVVVVSCLIWALNDQSAPKPRPDMAESASAEIEKPPFAVPASFTLVRDDYVVQGQGHKDQVGVSVMLFVLFKKRPTQEKAYSVMIAELAKYVRQTQGALEYVDIGEYAGDPEKPVILSQQLKDQDHDYYMNAWFDPATNTVMKGPPCCAQPAIHDVLPSAEALAAKERHDVVKRRLAQLQSR